MSMISTAVIGWFLTVPVQGWLCRVLTVLKVKQSHTRLWVLGLELIPVSWQSSRRWLSHKPSGRLPLLSTRPTVTFPAKEITALGRYQIILVGDRGTQVACPKPLRNGAQPELKAPWPMNRNSVALLIAQPCRHVKGSPACTSPILAWLT